MNKYFMLAVLWLGSTGGAVALKVFESPALHGYQIWLTVVSVFTTIFALICVGVDSEEGR